MPLPQRPPRNQRETRQNQTVGRQSSPREIPEMQGATSTAPIYIDLDTDTGNNTQVNFLGRGRGRGQSRGGGRGQSRGQNRGQIRGQGQGRGSRPQQV